MPGLLFPCWFLAQAKRLRFWGEIVFACAAEWAAPIVWDVCKSGAWSDAVIWIAFSWIVNITTKIAYIFLHNKNPLFRSVVGQYCFIH